MYYRLLDDSDYYDSPGHIKSYPTLAEGISLRMGRFIDVHLDEPLRCIMDSEWGCEPMLMWGIEIKLMRNDLISALRNAGVGNLQTFTAVVENPYTDKDLLNYQAVNIIGLIAAADIHKSEITSFSDPPHIDSIIINPQIDSSKTNGALMFRMAESVSKIIVHEKIKLAIEEKFPSLEFIEAF